MNPLVRLSMLLIPLSLLFTGCSKSNSAGLGNTGDAPPELRPWSEIRSQALTLSLNGDVFVSDLEWDSATNGHGPVEKDRSNGESAAGDGKTLSLGKKTYAKGLGTHAGGELVYTLGGACSSLTALVGLDDEIKAREVTEVRGSVIFKVLGDDKVLFTSGVMRSVTPPQALEVNLSGVEQLKLVVNDAGDNNWYDHADWANAKLKCGAAGTGLSGQYFNTLELSGPAQVRTDPTVNFDWGENSPMPELNPDNFSVRWSGQIVPLYSESYTFTTTSDDGVRLWVNGQALVNNWTDHAPTEDSGVIALEAGQKYELKLEYFERSGRTTAKLEWQSARQMREVVPQSQLFPSTATVPVPPVPTAWEFCANEFNGCRFTGLRDVRFVLNGNVIAVKSHYGGLESCTSNHLEISNRDQLGNSGEGKCEYTRTYQTTTLQNPMPGMSGLGKTVTVPLGNPGYDGPRVGVASIPVGVKNSNDIGNFRVGCELSHISFDDPLVAPGQPGGSHLHLFFGNSSTDAFSTADSIAHSGRSTCAGGTLNRSAYWIPALIDASGSVMLPTSTNFYYKGGYNGVAGPGIQAMPEGLRIISGDKNNSSPWGAGRWNCEEPNSGWRRALQDAVNECKPGEHITLNILFPQCWDGINLDSSDHKRHMSYTANNACPSSHPVPIPEISLNISFQIPAGGAQGWHLSSDMYDYATLGGGHSAHADWWNGWDMDTENAWVKNCLNELRDCHNHLLGDGRTLY